ncbi:MAG: HlyD family type I secretion periplasmic adaptor subunit [Rhodobacteraceae bacterium]|nr:HlyD family type I secretion periplasmic adaptor subunit [Paracoccaceae bacterium]
MTAPTTAASFDAPMRAAPLPARAPGRPELRRPLALEEGAPPGLARGTVLVAVALVAGFLVWAGLIVVQETAKADGQLAPAAAIQRLQLPESGVVAELLVAENDRVSAGQPLLRLAPEVIAADRDRIVARRAALTMRAERLAALAAGRAPDFPAAAAASGLDWSAAEPHAAVEAATAQALAAAEDGRIAALEARIRQRGDEVRALEVTLAGTRQEIPSLSEEAETYRDMAERGLLARPRLLAAERALADAELRAAETEARIVTARSALAEAEAQLDEARLASRGAAAEELAAVRSELAELAETGAGESARVDRLVLRAPVAGTVQGIAVAPGQVPAPGADLMEIVPEAGGLVADVRIDPRDAGHVTPGQTARLTVTAWDGVTGAPLIGTVTRVSPAAFSDPEGRPWFAVRVSLPGDGLGETAFPLVPGMVVRADIETGERSLLEWLLKPVLRAFSTSFTER